MTIHYFTTGAASVGQSPLAYVDTDGVRGMYATFQGSHDGVGTIGYKLQGRLSSLHDWVDITPEQTGDAALEVVVFPQMRVSTTAATGGAQLITSLSGPNKIWA